MRKIREALKLPALEHFQDYKRSTVIVITFAYLLIADFMGTAVLGARFSDAIALYTTLPWFIIMAFVFRKVLFRDIKVFKDNLLPYTLFVLAGFVAHFLFATIGGNITVWLTPSSIPNQSVASDMALQTPLLSFVVMVIAGPVLEELLYRRGVRIAIKNDFLYYFISSLLFGIGHIIIGFSFPLSFAYIFTYAVGALVLAFVYDKSRNIWASIFVHMLNNGLGFAFILMGLQ